MDQVTFDRYARRAAGLLDRRSLFGGVSTALLAVTGVPLTTDAKKNNKNRKSKACKKRVKVCRADARADVCEGNEECLREVAGKCCKKACRSNQDAIDCCNNTGFCDQ